MFKIILCASDLSLIVVSSESAAAAPKEIRYYRLAAWAIGDCRPNAFHEIDADGETCRRRGIAAGLSFRDPPTEEFGTLDEIAAYIKAQ